MSRFILKTAAACVLLWGCWYTPAQALEPHQIALVTNRNVPESAELANFYARAREIPAGRVIELDLPVVDEIAFDRYEPQVRQPLREALRARGIDQQVTCLVTFYGVPLRIAGKTITAQQSAELAGIRDELQRTQRSLAGAVQRLEELAYRLDPGFRAQLVMDADMLARRAEHARRSVNASAGGLGDPAQREAVLKELWEISRALSQPMGDPPTTWPIVPPAQPARPHAAPHLTPQASEDADAVAREQLRALLRRSGNPFAYERLLQEQIVLLNPEHTDSALDSELALLWTEGYSRVGWQPNPLGYPFLGRTHPPRVLRVSRLDAPTAQIVRNIIEDAIRAENDGLSGKLVIDSRGLASPKSAAAEEPYGAFDQRLRDLAKLVRSTTRIEVVHDDGPEVIPAGSAIADVAMYCGWYSVSRYVPSMKFVPGAVAFHVASFELTGLRDPNNAGWCRGLLNDGVAATLGPVSEPILHAFPVPDDFFPLLLTGRLPLVEVYWRTVPMTSWKLSLIGDPLYTPFKVNPAMQVADLPLRLRAIFSDHSTTRPATK